MSGIWGNPNRNPALTGGSSSSVGGNVKTSGQTPINLPSQELNIGGWGRWGGSGESPNQVPDPDTGGGAGGGSIPGFSGTDPGTFGQPLYPWLMPYQGQFTAPMSPYETGALQGYNQFVGGGMGLGGANNYLNNELSGQYLNLNSNPYLQQIQRAEQGLKDYNDQQALARINSGMALGGNALSGARLGATNDYMRNSNNAFESMMGQLMNQNYGLERGLMSQAPGQLNALSNTLGGAYAQLFGMGALPRSIQQNDLNAQYNDFLRQTGGMQNAYQSPDQQILSMLYGGGYHGQYQPMYGSSTLDQIAGLLGGSDFDWSQIASLFSGGDTPQSQEMQADGVVIGHDSTTTPGTSGPANYYDKNWYLNALTQAEVNRQNQMSQAQKGPNTTIPAILTLLLSMLGKSGNKRSGGVGTTGPGATSSGSRGGSGRNRGLFESLFGHNPYSAGSPQAQAWDKYFNTYSDTPRNPADPYDTGLTYPMPGPIGYTPDNPLSGGGVGSFADFYNDLPPLGYDPNYDPSSYGGLSDADLFGGGGGMSGGDLWAAGGGDMGAGGVDF